MDPVQTFPVMTSVKLSNSDSVNVSTELKKERSGMVPRVSALMMGFSRLCRQWVGHAVWLLVNSG